MHTRTTVAINKTTYMCYLGCPRNGETPTCLAGRNGSIEQVACGPNVFVFDSRSHEDTWLRRINVIPVKTDPRFSPLVSSLMFAYCPEFNGPRRHCKRTDYHSKPCLWYHSAVKVIPVLKSVFGLYANSLCALETSKDLVFLKKSILRRYRGG